jgi:hypothetical protein
MHLFPIPRKICLSRSRNRKINFFEGSDQQPDRVAIMNADRESSVMLEANRLQIPIVSLVDSNIPLGLYRGITYPIPMNDSIQFIYPSRNSIMKTVPPEWGKMRWMKEGRTTHRSNSSNENYHCMHQMYKSMRSIEWSQLEMGVYLWIEQDSPFGWNTTSSFLFMVVGTQQPTSLPTYSILSFIFP